jgi:hypothetical protein
MDTFDDPTKTLGYTVLEGDRLRQSLSRQHGAFQSLEDQNNDLLDVFRGPMSPTGSYVAVQIASVVLPAGTNFIWATSPHGLYDSGRFTRCYLGGVQACGRIAAQGDARILYIVDVSPGTR